MTRPVVLATLAAAFAFACDIGCGSTGSKRFVFDARAGGVERAAEQPYSFTNANGWTVTLTKANVTIGPIYLNVIAPLRSAWRVDLFRPAYADTSHLGDGRIVGEVLSQITVDALSPKLVPFSTQGTMTQEQVRTAEVWLWPPPDVAPETTRIDTIAADVAGEAVRGDHRIKFRGALIIDEAWASDAKPGEHSAQPISEVRRVRGIPTSFVPDEGGSLEIRINASQLFAASEFSSLDDAPADDDGTKVLVQAKSGVRTTDQVMRNMFEGMRASNGTYAVRWVVP